MDPLFDYIRLATWKTNPYLYTTANLQRQMSCKPGRWLQYKGRKSEDGRLFFGTGEQNRKRHHVIQMSGGLAQQQYELWRNYPDVFYCTRLDIQVTIEEPKEHDARKLYRSLQRKGKSIVESPGTATVYLGVRTSDIFTRIYEKPIDNVRYLRCEFELKGQYSRQAFTDLRQNAITPQKLYAQCLNQARVPDVYKHWFSTGGDESGGLTAAERLRSLANTKAWLDNTETGIMRLLGAEDTRGMVLSFIERLEVAKHFAEKFDAEHDTKYH